MNTVVRQRAASGRDLESAVEEGTVRELTLTREPQMAGRARTFLRKTVVDWSLEEQAAETAELVLSELFNNALQHTASWRLGVGVRLRGELLFVEVLDQNPRQQLTPRAPDPEAENGRVLLIVQAVSLRWGRRREAGGWMTWACLALPGQATAPADDADGPAQGAAADSLPQPAPVAGADYPFPSYEGDCVSHSPPAAAPARNEAWEALADGLHVQRLALHREQLHEVVTAAPADVTLFTQASPAALTLRPDSPDGPQDLAAVTRAGLAHLVSLPAEHGTAAGESNPLAATGSRRIKRLR
ncbi:ATP-binding protein [Streptomyces sp. NRRL F-5053]|uniref:ATP-binding protein n=1 Tax=Streptomyces sp. NRRL F-5053 TaxID=1463854 RepID=UPI000691D389|nr:ATP-binding protein [Streptomyces sp. NRRL F-5053]